MRPRHRNSGNVPECIVRIRSHAMSDLTFVPRSIRPERGYADNRLVSVVCGSPTSPLLQNPEDQYGEEYPKDR
jgi:hypothetical protein